MRLRRLVADSLKRLVQLLHSAWSRQLSPENWCLGVENGLFPEFGGHFWVFLAILGRKPGTFPHFLWSRHPSAGTLRFWGHSSFVERQRSPAAPCAPYGGSPCSDFSFMRGCTGLKLSMTWARGMGGAMVRGWSNPHSRPRVSVPTGLFLGNRHTRGSRLESVFCCFAVCSPFYSLLPNVSVQVRRLVRRNLQRLVRCSFLP